MKKLYLVGIDAVPLWILKELAQRGKIGAFNKLLKEGAIKDMESTLPPLTGPAWPSIYTGLTPAEHGVPDFFVMKKNYTPDIVYYNSDKVPPVWENLAKSGKKSLLITPATQIMLPNSKNIDMITGFPLPSRTNSKQLESLMKKYNFYGEPDVETKMKSGKATEKDALAEYIKSIRSRAAITKEMLAKNDYDFVFVCFTETDRMQHFIMGKKDRNDYLMDIYAEIGSFIEYLMQRAEKEEAAFAIVSDHGMQPIKHKFLLNAWLIQNGYIKMKVSQSKKEKAAENRQSSIRESLIRNHGLRKIYDSLPHSLKSAVFKTFGAVFPAQSGGESRLHLFDFDMAHTKAFAAISNNPVATIWINDDRFTNGIVGKKERDALKAELTSKLNKLQSKEGDKLVVDIIDGNSYYGKTKKFIAPDLFIEAKKGYTFDIFNFSKDRFFSAPEGAKSGDHLRHGIFAFSSTSTSANSDGISVLDVTPLILDYFGTKRKVGGASRLVKRKSS